MFPFSIAKKLPVFFYGRVKFSSLKGKITIQAPIKSGMIGFGQKFEKMTLSKGVAEIFIDGTLEFKGHAHFGKDVFLSVNKGAFCQFGFMGCLGSDVKLICTNKIVIGDWTGIGYESQIIDTNSHPMKNTLTNKHYPINGQIIIGNYNAISNRVSIMLGTKTADNTVIASNSLCNKDYTGLGNNVLIGGIPSKIIKNNFKRDWEIEKENLMKSKRVVL
tara:strand:- start:819 stop:1472 length:654 start_codon:yes stop_codon:yes gene_type:complete